MCKSEVRVRDTFGSDNISPMVKILSLDLLDLEEKKKIQGLTELWGHSNMKSSRR